MKICGLQKLSLLDYPGYTAATVFTGGCNFRCPFCHNSSLVLPESFDSVLSEQDFFLFLEKRVGLLDGVCISGGEPLIQNDIKPFIRKIKSLGFKVKLDTNGSFPDRLKDLVSDQLIDYIAMDIKNGPSSYGKTVGMTQFDMTPILESIRYIMNCGVPYEFRTTLVKEFHTADDIKEIGKMIQNCQQYFLQSFVDSGALIGEGLHEFDKIETENFVKLLSSSVNNTQIRGK